MAMCAHPLVSIPSRSLILTADNRVQCADVIALGKKYGAEDKISCSKLI